MDISSIPRAAAHTDGAQGFHILDLQQKVGTKKTLEKAANGGDLEVREKRGGTPKQARLASTRSKEVGLSPSL